MKQLTRSEGPGSRTWLLATLTVILSGALALLVFEVAARAFIEPSDRGFGRLAGIELPPLRIVPDPETYLADGPEGQVATVSGDSVSVSDLWGLWRRDPVVGYVQQEDARSAGGWWHSNNRGRRLQHGPGLPAVS